jgi:putative hemolysin
MPPNCHRFDAQRSRRRPTIKDRRTPWVRRLNFAGFRSGWRATTAIFWPCRSCAGRSSPRRWARTFPSAGHPPAAIRIDSDPYDALCDHLLVVDEDGCAEDGGRGPLVVGTYRLLRESVARKASGFYSEGEFDLSRLAGAQRGGELLELGRSCVLPAYRTSATISLLWRGIADYLALHDIGLMFGCASFPGIDPDAHAAALSYLHHVCLAPDYQRPAVLPGKGIALERLPRGSYDERRALVQLPPLIKGYLRAGPVSATGRSWTVNSTRSTSAS